jgi:hypothetical protein
VPARVENVDFWDRQYFEDMKEQNQKLFIERFMLHLAVCHTVITEKKYFDH